jgi:hypothetical protein
MKQVGRMFRNFDLDLEYGEAGESELLSILKGVKKVEVKTDRLAHVTGNIAVEFRCYGKNSGISTTEADYWAFVLLDGKMIILIETNELKVIARQQYKLGNVKKGGDDHESEMILVPINKLYERSI